MNEDDTNAFPEEAKALNLHYMHSLRSFLALASVLIFFGCDQNPRVQHSAKSASHQHVAPHGGFLIELGDEVAHVELVHDLASGRMTAYLLDGELEKFLRSSQMTLEIEARVGGATHLLVFRPVANAATGESVGDTSQFEAQADWLKTANSFEGTLKGVSVRGVTFEKTVFLYSGAKDRRQ